MTVVLCIMFAIFTVCGIVSPFLCLFLLKCVSIICFKCPDMFRARETRTLLQSEPDLVTKMAKTQYCHTTLNTLPHTPWPEPHMDHRGEGFMNASAPWKH